MPPKSTPRLKSFSARLEPDGMRLRWTVLRLPFDPAQVWPEHCGRRVRGTIEGIPFRSSLFGNRRGAGAWLVVNRQLQAAAGRHAGELARVRIEPDTEERPVEEVAEFERILRSEPALRNWTNRLSPSMRREIARWIAQPRSAASRKIRAEAMAERLLLTMEGERTIPPALQTAFFSTPLARKGWERMTPISRHKHLLAIFSYRSPEAREKRITRTVADALRVARRA